MEQRSNLDFVGGAKVTGLPQATAAGEPATFDQLQALIDKNAYKDDVRVSTQANINLASPGAAIDAIAMAAGDRVLVRVQTAQTENGIYLWNGAAAPMTRSSDADTFDELESATTTVGEGTSSGIAWRQTQVNGIIGTNNILWAQAGSVVGVATTTQTGTVILATQAEVDAGLASKAVTADTLAAWAGRPKRFAITFGDGAATQYDLLHNLNTVDVEIEVRKVSDNSKVNIDTRALNANTARINSVGIIAANSLRAIVIA